MNIFLVPRSKDISSFFGLDLANSSFIEGGFDESILHLSDVGSHFTFTVIAWQTSKYRFCYQSNYI